jgi:hypothetical protein
MIAHRTLCFVIALASFATVSVAQDQGALTLLEQRLQRLVTQLGDSSWTVRERSTLMIGDPNEGYELGMLAEILQEENLTPEVRLRLWRAARLLFGQTTKAGLGVGFGAVRDGGIEIRSVVENVDQFPAAGMLMPGDLIVGVDGKSLTSSEDLRAMILSHEPGELLNLLVDRGGEVLDLDLPLGSYQMLRGAAPISTPIANQAIDIRWARKGYLMPGVNTVGSGITSKQWVEAGYPEEPGSFRASNARRTPRVVSPGSSRDVFVGTGTLSRGRIEPWSNRTNAQAAIDQSRRIVLSQQMNIARTRIKLLSGGLDTLKKQAELNPGDGTIKSKIAAASAELRTTRRDLEVYTKEFESLVPSP